MKEAVKNQKCSEQNKKILFTNLMKCRIHSSHVYKNHYQHTGSGLLPSR
jgi:hypothetical protein